MPSTGAILQAIIVVGVLLLASSTLSKRWCYAEWVKTAFWIAFIAAMLNMALAFILTRLAFFGCRILAHPRRQEHLLGIAVGMLSPAFFALGRNRRPCPASLSSGPWLRVRGAQAQ